jgi:hypothetical protein
LFKCPYLFGEEVHQPDIFREILEEIDGNMGNYVPAIPVYVSINSAINLIRESRSIMAFILVDMRWIQTVIPLDKNTDGTWWATKVMSDAWIDLTDIQLKNEILI